MKLYSVDVTEDCENYNILVVANSKEEAEDKVYKMGWDCPMCNIATEVDMLDGYKIILKKINNSKQNKTKRS